jgi:transcriptional regulator with XRE-family HTH domain
MATFGARLKHLREARRWDQKELARRAGVPYMTIYRLETEAHRTPRMDIAVKIARTLGISLDVLCGMYEDKESEMFPTELALARREA